MLTKILNGPVTAVSRAFALLGGVVLVVLMLLVIVSITGRALIPLGLRPVPGDFELVAAGTAFAVFCFLPWCQLERGHVSVDILAPLLGRRRDAALSIFHNLLMTAASAFIAAAVCALASGVSPAVSGVNRNPISRPTWWPSTVTSPFDLTSDSSILFSLSLFIRTLVLRSIKRFVKPSCKASESRFSISRVFSCQYVAFCNQSGRLDRYVHVRISAILAESA